MILEPSETLAVRGAPLHPARAIGRALVALAALVVPTGACGDDPKKRLGDLCGADYQCESGLCMEQRCVDPEADADDDGLVNRVEVALATNGLLKDSDADGVLDLVEVGDVATPRDFDGDGQIDAIESAREDFDDDCVPDERDAQNGVVEGDLAVVADLACCCGGRCSTQGVSATATCTGGALACDPAEPDRDGDGTADACDTPALELPTSEIERACSEVCGRIVEGCDGAPPACVADCVARTSDEGLWLANYVCLAASCSEAECFDPPGFAEEASCRRACDQYEACGVGVLAPADPPSVARCRAACAGEHAAQNAAGTAVYACLAGLDATAECRLVDALPCVLGDQLCRQACGKLTVPTEGEPVCRVGSPIYGRYATDAACTSACTGLGGFGEVAFLGCSAVRGCSDFGPACDADPDTVASGCSEACAAIGATCDFTGSPFRDSGLCGAFCTGLTLAAPWVAPADAADCIQRADGCDTAEEATAVLASCVLDTAVEPRCDATCTRLEDCAEELQRPVPPDCERGCAGLTLMHPERIEPTFACLDEAATCSEVPGCLPPSPDDVCTPACNHVLACSPNYLGGLAQCVADCRDGLAADIDAYAAWMCEALAGSCNVACGDLPTLPPDAACVTACAGQDTCIEAGYGLCARACQGARRAYGESSDTCVRERLGRRCNAVAAKACDPS